MKKSLLTVLACFALAATQAQKIVSEPFNYPNGQLSGQGGWSQAQGTNYFSLMYPGLQLSGYPLNQGDSAVALFGASSIGQSSKNLDTVISTGEVYCSFLMNVIDAPTNPDFIFGFTPSAMSPTYLGGRLLVKKSSDNYLSFEVQANLAGTANSKTAFSYPINRTYLFVIKYTFVPGTGNDEIRLFIFATIPPEEPGTPTVGPVTDPANGDMDDIDRISIIAHTAETKAIIDGVIVSTTWAGLFSPITAIGDKENLSLPMTIPNPVRNSISFAAPVTAEISDLNGQVLLKVENTNNINTAGLPDGCYMISVNHDKGAQHQLMLVRKE